MIGMVLIGHARIASEMLNALQYIVGEQPLIQVVDVDDHLSPELLSTRINQAVTRCNTGDGVLILADMFGGTPCNVAIGCLEAGRVEVISGFNLPLLIKAASERKATTDLAQFAKQVSQAGRHYIQTASQVGRHDG